MNGSDDNNSPPPSSPSNGCHRRRNSSSSDDHHQQNHQQFSPTNTYMNNSDQLQLSLAFPGSDYDNYHHPQPPMSPPVFTFSSTNPLFQASSSTHPPTLNPPIQFYTGGTPLPPPPPPVQLHNQEVYHQPVLALAPGARPPRRQQQRNRAPTLSKNLPKGKTLTIPPPYPWATDRRCQLHPLHHLKEKGITEIFGRVQCKKCERSYEIAFDIESKFGEIGGYIFWNRDTLKTRAPEIWNNPSLPDCHHCHHKNAVKPELAGKKRNINWLFLFLGQMLGCCKLNQLRYFCKHTCNHRTGAKDRVLYLAYMEIFKQLYPPHQDQVAG